MWKYLKKLNASVNAECDGKSLMRDCLPQATGPLSRIMPTNAIESASEAVLKCLEQTEQAKLGRYQKYSSKEKADIGKRAVEYSITTSSLHQQLCT